MKIVCLGDSLTFGYGIEKKYRWTEILKSELNVEIINRGVNGDTTAAMLMRFYNEIIKYSPTHLIIMGGTNDFIGGLSPINVFHAIKLIIEDCIKNNIVPIPCIQPSIYANIAKLHWAETINYDEINKKIEEYRNSLVLYLINNKIMYADLYSVFSASTVAPYTSANINSSNDLFIDGIHPSAKGHKIIADILMGTVNNY